MKSGKVTKEYGMLYGTFLHLDWTRQDKKDLREINQRTKLWCGNSIISRKMKVDTSAAESDGADDRVVVSVLNNSWNTFAARLRYSTMLGSSMKSIWKLIHRRRWPSSHNSHYT